MYTIVCITILKLCLNILYHYCNYLPHVVIQVPIVAKEDKRQITAVMGITMSGVVLPPQILYQGKTVACHPPKNVKFPSTWDIWHSETHWANEETVLRYINKVIIPFVQHIKAHSHMAQSQPALLIMDIYKSHVTTSVLEFLKQNGIIHVIVPPNCTSELQPLDSIFNRVLKQKMAQNFNTWYAKSIYEHLERQQNIQNIEVNMKLSFIKPLHAAWMIEAINSMSEDKQLVKQCWEAVGIQHPFCSIQQTCAVPVHEFDPARLGITVNTVPSFDIETLARRMLGNQVKPDQEFNVISIAPNTIKGVLEGQQFIWNRQTDGLFEAVIAVPPGGAIHVY